MEEQSILVDPAIFEHLQEKIDEDTAFRDVSTHHSQTNTS